MTLFNDCTLDFFARFQVFGAPYESAGNDFPAGLAGPNTIRSRSYDMRGITFFTALGYQRDMRTISGSDSGDTELNDPEAIVDMVEHTVLKGQVPIVIGGDDEVSAHVVSGAQKAAQRGVRVIQFDAHLDLERGGLYHGSWARHVVEQPWCRRFEIRGPRGAVFTDTVQHGLPRVKIVPVTALVRKSTLPTILCVDVDIFDPGDAPGVGYRVPFGQPALNIIQSIERVCLATDVIAVAVTEYHPGRDIDFLTADLVVSVINHIIVSVNSRRAQQS